MLLGEVLLRRGAFTLIGGIGDHPNVTIRIQPSCLIQLS